MVFCEICYVGLICDDVFFLIGREFEERGNVDGCEWVGCVGGVVVFVFFCVGDVFLD